MAAERKFVFTWLDLLAPWAICLGSAALCAWAAFKGTPMGTENILIPRIISILVGVLFLSGIPLWYLVRSKVRKATYFTKDGVAVVLGKYNRPAKEDVESWSDSVSEHWQKAEWSHGDPPIKGPVKKTQVDLAFQQLTCFCFDKEKLSIWGRIVRGWSLGKDIGIGYQQGKPEYTQSLYRHEASHSILDQTSLPWDGEVHHNLFKETGLGA